VSVLFELGSIAADADVRNALISSATASGSSTIESSGCKGKLTDYADGRHRVGPVEQLLKAGAIMTADDGAPVCDRRASDGPVWPETTSVPTLAEAIAGAATVGRKIRRSTPRHVDLRR
jgi:hypothetical protein